MSAQEGGAPLTAEQLATAVTRLVRGVNEGYPGEAARELFSDDGEFSAALIESLPRLVSTAARAVIAFAESVEGMPADKGARLFAGSYAGIDGAEIGEAVNAVSRMIIRLHEEDPELIRSGRTGIASDAIKAIDFGKLRKAVTYRGGERLGALRGEVELLGENPISLINMFSVVAPLANEALQVLKAVFVALDFPAEAMTYALFKIVQDIDWRDAATVVNGLAALIVNLHRGSLILGDGSLYTREPFYRISSDVVSSLDGRVLAEAVAAIGEEGEAFSAAFLGKVMEDEGLLVSLTEAGVSLANSAFRAVYSILEKANALSRETLEKMLAVVASDLETAEMGRAAGVAAALGRRTVEENRELAYGLARQVLSSLELDASPEAVAKGLNRALASCNAWMDVNPDLLAARLTPLFAELDARELERAAKSASGQVADALTRNPALMRSLLKAALSVIAGGIRGYLRGLKARRRKRGV